MLYPLGDLFKYPIEIEILVNPGLQSRVQLSLETPGSFSDGDGNNKKNSLNYTNFGELRYHWSGLSTAELNIDN